MLQNYLLSLESLENGLATAVMSCQQKLGSYQAQALLLGYTREVVQMKQTWLEPSGSVGTLSLVGNS